jgi:hypothetical protein
MYWFWLIMMAAQPAFLFVGMTGLFGDDGKKAAEDLHEVFGVLLIVVVIIAAVVVLAIWVSGLKF